MISTISCCTWSKGCSREPAIQSVYSDRFKYLLVDEYQDTNRAQYLLVQHLAKQHHNLWTWWGTRTSA